MSEHIATLRWTNSGGEFLKGRFSRVHTWSFDGGLSVPAAASPAVVPPALGNPANIDPEEALVASLSSCHLLTFLFFAYRAGFQVDSYEDHAVGTMSKNEHGAPWISSVTLHPKIAFGGTKVPTSEELEQLHHHAHEQCVIANSVKTQISIESA
jgi:organic hydroperoxide reductase OsmC/OhrA